jgi:hypothetical protein
MDRANNGGFVRANVKPERSWAAALKIKGLNRRGVNRGRVSASVFELVRKRTGPGEA